MYFSLHSDCVAQRTCWEVIILTLQLFLNNIIIFRHLTWTVQNQILRNLDRKYFFK